MKNVLKLLGWFLASVVAGLMVGALGVVIFTDTTLHEFYGNLISANFLEVAGAALTGMVATLAAIVILVVVHEAGHLVCGMATGYGFVSFRIFNLTFIRIDGKIKVKRFAVAGTGGQCLLTPPDLPVDQIPTACYNAGGVLANIVALLIMAPLLLLDLHPVMSEVLVIFCVIDVVIILLNGIPMKLGGIGNDAYNMFYLRNNPLSKRALLDQLRSNALLQNGVRPGEMPDEWFEWKADVDYKNPLEVSIPMMFASRCVDELDFETAYHKFEELYSHKADMIQLYVNEIACELAFCAMATGRRDRAESLLDAKLMGYVEAYRSVMSSKQRLLCAKALCIDNDPDGAQAIYKALESSKDKYLMQGEVRSDLAIMETILR